MKTSPIVLATLSFLSLTGATVGGALPAYCDDGGISYGGSPHLLSGHDSVAMKSEVVKMDIHAEKITVDCNFVFHNSSSSPATVRMGFPDQGEGAQIPYEGEELPKKNLKATFLTYDSYVDGKKVPTKVVPSDSRELFWHEKTVTFPANKDCIIRDVYTLLPGGQQTTEPGGYRQTYYVLHTGASWHGPIGKADVLVTFASDAIKDPIKLKSLKTLPEKDISLAKWSKIPKGTVLYGGPCEPKLEGRTLKFSVSNLKPTKNDDVRLYYGWTPNK